MPDDYPGDTTSTASLATGSTVSGTIEAANDSDFFRIQLTAGFNYQFSLASFSGSSDIGLQLYNASSTRVAGSTTPKTIIYVPTVSGFYFVDVKGGASTGVYTLSASPADDYTGDTSTAGRFAIGGNVNGRLEASSDVDAFAVDLTAGLNYQFNILNFASSGSDIGLQLYNASFTRVAGNTTPKTLSFLPTVSGRYYLDVVGGTNTGTYTLGSSPLDDFTGDNTTVGRLPIGGGSLTGNLEAVSDVDSFAVQLAAGASYTFNLSSFNGSGSGPGLQLYNAAATRVAGNTSPKTITFTPVSSGTYYLDVIGGNSTGTYTLNAATTGIPVFRFFDSRTGTQFLTSSTSERDTVISTRPDLVNEGVGLAAAGADPSASPVYRFFDTIYGTHFFTSSSSERDTIQATRADLTYEGIAFNEYLTQQPGTSAVYRFFDSNRGTHFFTGSATERATIIATRADLVPEGISFYSPPMS